MQTDCVRCLESVSPAVEAEVDITLLASAEPVPADTEKKGRKVNGEDNRIEDWTAEDFPDPEALGESTYSGETARHPLCASRGPPAWADHASRLRKRG